MKCCAYWMTFSPVRSFERTPSGRRRTRGRRRSRSARPRRCGGSSSSSRPATVSKNHPPPDLTRGIGNGQFSLPTCRTAVLSDGRSTCRYSFIRSAERAEVVVLLDAVAGEDELLALVAEDRDERPAVLGRDGVLEDPRRFFGRGEQPLAGLRGAGLLVGEVQDVVVVRGGSGGRVALPLLFAQPPVARKAGRERARRVRPSCRCRCRSRCRRAFIAAPAWGYAVGGSSFGERRANASPRSLPSRVRSPSIDDGCRRVSACPGWPRRVSALWEAAWPFW